MQEAVNTLQMVNAKNWEIITPIRNHRTPDSCGTLMIIAISAKTTSHWITLIGKVNHHAWINERTVWTNLKIEANQNGKMP